MARLLFVIVILMLFVSYLPVGCGSGGGSGGGSIVTDTRIEQAPLLPPRLVVTAVRELGPIRTNDAIRMRDCGFSALYQGKSVWLFGDTLLASPSADDRLMLANSLSLTYDLDAGDGIEGLWEPVDAVGAPMEFFPLTQEELRHNAIYGTGACDMAACSAGHWRIWPGAMIVDPDRDWAYVFYRKVNVGSSVFDFEHVGHSVAVWKGSDEAAERPVFNQVESYPTLLFSEADEPGFGSAALVADKQAYIYGCELEEDLLTKPCYLARVAIADILDKQAWQYFAGGERWSTDVQQAAAIFNGNDMMSVSFNPYINGYIAVYSEPLKSAAMLRTALKPEGPWSDPIQLFTVDAPENYLGWVYDFLAHPQYSQDGGRILYITYTKNIDEASSEHHLVAVEIALAE